MKIYDVINRRIKPKTFNRQKPKLVEIREPLPLNHLKSKPIGFERKVFNHLLENKDELGVTRIYQLRNARADGPLELDSGATVLLEIKYALGWARCCLARIQFQWFLIQEVYDKLSIEKPKNSLIVFHHFSGDWAKYGWDYFYDEESDLNVSLVKTDIAQLDDGHLIFYPGCAD